MTAPHHKRSWFGLQLWHRIWRWIKSRLPSIKWLEHARLCLEILAILAGGVWAIYTFFIAEHRTFQEGGALASTIEWRRTPDGDCSGDYIVTFRNVSKIPVTISTGKLRIWRLKKFTPNAPDEPVRYIIPTDLRQDLLLEKETGRFNGRYQPDESDEEGFTFDLNKLETGPILFELILWDDDGLKRLHEQKKDVSTLAPTEAAEARWDNNRWDWPCFEKPKESATKGF